MPGVILMAVLNGSGLYPLEGEKMKSKSFSTLAGQFAIAAGILGFLYSLSFVFLKNDLLTALFLLLGGLCSLIALTGLYEQFRTVEPSYALLAFLLSAGAAAGS